MNVGIEQGFCSVKEFLRDLNELQVVINRLKEVVFMVGEKGLEELVGCSLIRLYCHQEKGRNIPTTNNSKEVYVQPFIGINRKLEGKHTLDETREPSTCMQESCSLWWEANWTCLLPLSSHTNETPSSTPTFQWPHWKVTMESRRLRGNGISIASCAQV